MIYDFMTFWSETIGENVDRHTNQMVMTLGGELNRNLQLIHP